MSGVPKLGQPPERLGRAYVETAVASKGGNAAHRLTLWKRLGISGRAVVNVGAPIAVCNVQPLPNGLFKPTDHDGVEAVVTPMVEGGVAIDQRAKIIDRVAFRPNEPRRWRQRTGAGTILGADTLRIADWFDEPLALFLTPLAWLQAECEDACIIDWRANLPFLLNGIRRVICDDVELADHLDRTVTRPDGSPFLEIRIQENTRVAA